MQINAMCNVNVEKKHVDTMILTRNRRRKSIPKQYTSWTVNHNFDCASKTLNTVYSLSLISISQNTVLNKQSIWERLQV